MFQTKARRFVPVLALTAALSLSPLAPASAATAGAPDEAGLLAQLQEQVVLIWDALKGAWETVGPRMDDNG